MFEGTRCEIFINDEELYGKNHNYISVVVDDREPKRIKLQNRKNAILVADDLLDGKHTLLLCKSTEAGIGYLEFAGIKCKKIWPAVKQDERKIEFIGNSITCSTGSDLTIPCGTKEWYDQHNAYMSYGPVTARYLNAQWQLTAVSGIGLVHSCCDLKYLMPDVFDKINLRDNKQIWEFKNYQPDVLTICLGQNDGIQDSLFYAEAYISFIKKLRQVYPHTAIVRLVSPMADDELLAVMKKYLAGIVKRVNIDDENVSSYFFSKRYYKGCGDHPNLNEHQQMAVELSEYIRKLKAW